MSKLPPGPIEVEVTALASGGTTIGLIENPESLRGKKVFVPYAVPGERIEAALVKDKGNFATGTLLRVIRSAPERASAPCPHFSACGGCDYQHIALHEQRKMKLKLIEDTLRIQAGISPLEGVHSLGGDLDGYGYRRRMSFHLNREGRFGLYRKGTRSIVELERCLISCPVINTVIAESLPLLRGLAPEIETVTIEDHDSEPYIVLEMHPRSREPLDTLLSKHAFQELLNRYPKLRVQHRHRVVFPAAVGAEEIPAGHFSQNNREANALMLRRIVELAAGSTVTDLYAGAGNISLPLAEAGKSVTAVEMDGALTAFGAVETARRGLSERLRFVTASCDDWIKVNTPSPTVVIDPPRSGALAVAEHLSPLSSPLMVYVSCYPPTFIRDSQVLVSRGYRLTRVDVLDMFPQTGHSELIGLFQG
jgi:23S rRNA (uracil1939-C5)-methyltransferase